MSLVEGSLVAGRFLIEGLAGKGGMGEVFRARDTSTGTTVALKLLHAQADGLEDLERFQREARVLSQLEHPGIVSYLSHGQTEDGRPYLAIEWLSGHDLGQRLAQGPLGIRDCVTLLRNIVNALAVAHGRGIVHRDIKPSNLFLRHDEIARVTLLDFGIARQSRAATALTRTGHLIGTPDYMAPEQARGDRDLGPTADVFSLGCVLFACLTGRPPFSAQNLVAILAKVLFEEAPAVETLRPDTPPVLSALLARMLDKDPSRRHADALALRDALFDLTLPRGDETVSLPGVDPSPAPAALSEHAMMLLCVVVAVPGIGAEPPASAALAAGALPQAPRDALRARLVLLGGRVEWLADGSLAVVVPPAQSVIDQVEQAARCALVIKESWPDARVALTTGRGVLRERLPVGEAIERAVSLLGPRGGDDSGAEASMTEESGVWLDALSARLLSPRFAITTTRSLPVLRGTQASTADASRPLLGRPTPCVGREQDLAMLGMAIDRAIEASEPAGALVIAPPGMGKSRLRHELLRRLGARELDIEVLSGSGAPLRAGSPYGLLGEALRRLCDVHIGDPPTSQEEKIMKRAGARVAPSNARRVGEFIATLCGITVAEPSVVLRAAYSDPKIMNEQIQRAFVDLLSAECAARPVLLVLEDLHWSDPATVRLLDDALVGLLEKPFFVLAFARPEVSDLFPNLWEGRTLQRIRLAGLSKKAAERLITSVLGAEVAAATAARMIEQAAGNALFLEELIRAAAEGKAEGQPETVLAMLQARLSCLDTQARRVLSAASIFGQTFWRGGVRTLLGRNQDTQQTADRLEELARDEIVVKQWGSRFPGETEYKFRHALVRDAAYGLLTDDDRRLGHRLSGMYLEQIGEADPMVLAEHAHEGGDLPCAAVHYLHAAMQSHQAEDHEGMCARVDRGITCGAQGEVLGQLLALKLHACMWRLDWQTGVRIGQEAMRLLPQGSVPWNNAATSIITITSNLCLREEVDALVSVLSDAVPAPDALASYLVALGSTTAALTAIPARETVLRLLARQDDLAAGLTARDILARGSMHFARWCFDFMIGDDIWAAHESARLALEAFEAACSSRWQQVMSFLFAMTLGMLGDASAEGMLRECLESALRTNDVFTALTARFYLMLYLVERGPLEWREEIKGHARVFLDHAATEDTVGMAHGALARVLLVEGRIEEAREAAEKSLDIMQYLRCWRPSVERTLIEALVREGRSDAACHVAKESLRSIEAMGGSAGFCEVPLRLAIAEAHIAAQDTEAIPATLAAAVRAIERRASRIPDPARRARYLQIPENVRVLLLSRGHLD